MTSATRAVGTIGALVLACATRGAGHGSAHEESRLPVLASQEPGAPSSYCEHALPGGCFFPASTFHPKDAESDGVFRTYYSARLFDMQEPRLSDLSSGVATYRCIVNRDLDDLSVIRAWHCGQQLCVARKLWDKGKGEYGALVANDSQELPDTQWHEFSKRYAEAQLWAQDAEEEAQPGMQRIHPTMYLFESTDSDGYHAKYWESGRLNGAQRMVKLCDYMMSLGLSQPVR